MWQIWLLGLKEPIGMVLSRPKEGLTFGGLSQRQSLKRAAPGAGPPFCTLRVGFGTGGVRAEHGMGSQAGDPKQIIIPSALSCPMLVDKDGSSQLLLQHHAWLLADALFS